MTLLELTILSIIAEQECHAYQVELYIREQGFRQYLEIGFSSIYSALRKLQKIGLLSSRRVSRPHLPIRRIYTLTTKGQRIFREELLNILTRPNPKADALQLGLKLSRGLSTAELREALQLYEAELGREIREKMTTMTQIRSTDIIETALLSRSLALLRTERKWVQEQITQL
jgi:DNA-binding PadR family transcriptional regulator